MTRYRLVRYFTNIINFYSRLIYFFLCSYSDSEFPCSLCSLCIQDYIVCLFYRSDCEEGFQCSGEGNRGIIMPKVQKKKQRRGLLIYFQPGWVTPNLPITELDIMEDKIFRY